MQPLHPTASDEIVRADELAAGDLILLPGIGTARVLTALHVPAGPVAADSPYGRIVGAETGARHDRTALVFEGRPGFAGRTATPPVGAAYYRRVTS